MKNKNSHTGIMALCECAVLIAAAQILGYLKLFRLPNGGSVTLNMLPILMICIRWGAGYGFASGLIFGLMQLLLDGGIGFGWQSILGDYIVAYTALGFAGIIHSDTLKKAVFSITLGGLARYTVAVIVGATVWAEYMPDEFWGLNMNNPWIYSTLYNASYIVPATILCIIVAVILWKTMNKYFRRIG